MDPLPARAPLVELLTAHGEAARAATYQHRWEYDAALWAAVTRAIDEAPRSVSQAGHGQTTQSPPRWLEGAVRRHLSNLATHWSFTASFSPVRILERLDLVDLPVDDDYVLAVVGGLAPTAGERAGILRDDPELCQRVVWSMFQVEGGGEVSLANVDKFTADDQGWRATFLELVADGTLRRDRVLTCCLDALNRDFSAYRAGWYRRLYEALDPDPDEVVSHRPRLGTLVGVSVPATVGFAVKYLAATPPVDSLDAERTMAALQAVPGAGPVGTARRALRLAEQMAKDRPELASAAVEVATAGLAHPGAEVQAAAVEMLDRLGRSGPAIEMIDGLEPTVQAQVRELLTDVAAKGTTRAPTNPVPPHPADESDWTPGRTPAIGPIDDLRPARGPELVESLSALLEGACDPDQVEAVLAGLALLDEPTPLYPLARRALRVLDRAGSPGRETRWLRIEMARLVVSATGGDPGPRAVPGDPVTGFLAGRLDELAQILTGRHPPGPALATPLDPTGWLPADVLVERLEARQRAGLPEPSPFDLIAALLRLEPGGREQAATRITQSPALVAPPLTRVLLHALGGPAPRESKALRGEVKAHRALWVAASRSRGPLTTDHWLERLDVTGPGRSRALEATVLFSPEPYSWEERGRTRTAIHWRWRVEVPGAIEATDPHEPTAIDGGGDFYWWGTPDRSDLAAWVATLWPHDAEHLLIHGVSPVLATATSREVRHDAVPYLHALTDHPGRLGTLAALTLAAGLNAGRPEQRASTVDAVVELSGRPGHGSTTPAGYGPITADQLANGLRTLGEVTSPKRLASSMRDLAAVDRSGTNLAIDALAGFLPSLAVGVHGIHALTERLHEMLEATGRPTPDHLRPWLEMFGGSSRAARSARSLLVRS